MSNASTFELNGIIGSTGWQSLLINCEGVFRSLLIRSV